MRSGLIARVLLAAVLVGGAPPPAGAQAPEPAPERPWGERGYRAVVLGELQGGQVKPEEPVALEVGVAAISGQQLLVSGSDLLFVVEPVVGPLHELREGASVRVYGRLVRTGTPPRLVFRVEHLEAAQQGDASLAQEAIARLRAAGDVEGLFALGRSLRERAEGAEPRTAASLRELAQAAFRQAVAIARDRLDPADRRQVLALADRALELTRDRALALELLQPLLVPGQAPDPELQRRLQQLNAVPYGRTARWVLFEEMKRQEGFVERGGSWVLAERAALLDAAERQRRERKRPRAGMLPEFFAAAMRAGQVLAGMNKKEVAGAIGLPDRFDRVRVGGNVYDAWIYEGRGAYYFENDVLFEKPQ